MRNDLIIAINNIFDENVNLKVRNEYLEKYHEEHEKPKTCCADKRTEVSPIDLKVIAYGKEKLCDEVLKGWNNVEVHRDEETKELKTTSYEKWLDSKIYKDYIPDNMTRNEVMNIIYDNAIEIYEKEKIQAIQRFEEKELEKQKGGEEDE